MKKFLDNYKDKFNNRSSSSYVGLKIVGLLVLVAIFAFIVYLILSETVLAADLPQKLENTVEMEIEITGTIGSPEIVNTTEIPGFCITTLL